MTFRTRFVVPVGGVTNNGGSLQSGLVSWTDLRAMRIVRNIDMEKMDEARIRRVQDAGSNRRCSTVATGGGKAATRTSMHCSGSNKFTLTITDDRMHSASLERLFAVKPHGFVREVGCSSSQPPRRCMRSIRNGLGYSPSYAQRKGSISSHLPVRVSKQPIQTRQSYHQFALSKKIGRMWCTTSNDGRCRCRCRCSNSCAIISTDADTDPFNQLRKSPNAPTPIYS